jgi:hypothetical protein
MYRYVDVAKVDKRLQASDAQHNWLFLTSLDGGDLRTTTEMHLLMRERTLSTVRVRVPSECCKGSRGKIDATCIWITLTSNDRMKHDSALSEGCKE